MSTDDGKVKPVIITNMPELPYIRVVRWFLSREVLTYLATAFVTVIPFVLTKLGTLGFSDTQLLFWTITVMLVQQGASTYLKATQKVPTVTGSKAAVAAAKENAPEPSP